MATAAQKPVVDLATETPAERDARLAWERERLTEAEADLAAGRYIEGDAALDWLDRWTSGEDLEDPLG